MDPLCRCVFGILPVLQYLTKAHPGLPVSLSFGILIFTFLAAGSILSPTSVLEDALLFMPFLPEFQWAFSLGFPEGSQAKNSWRAVAVNKVGGIGDDK